MNEEVFIPITGCLMIFGIVWLFQYFASRKRIEAYKTLQAAIEKGQPLTPEALESMARLKSPIADLRWGIIWVAIAAGFASFSFISFGYDGEGAEVRQGLLGVATFPLFIGLAFLGLHFFANDAKRR